MIEVKVMAPNATELAVLVKSLAAQFGVSLSNAEAEMVVEAEPVLETQIELPVEEKPKKAAKKKEEKVEAKEEIKEEAPKAKTQEETKTALTKQDIADACQKVSSTKNLEAAKAILAQFKSEKGEACRRISDVLEADYAAFIAKCNQVLA